MIPHILAAGREALAAGFAIAVAMAVLGTFLSRWYRMRQEYLLLRLAMEKGITPPSNPTLPQWLISLRQGVLIVTLGLALAIIGGIGWRLGMRAQQSQLPNRGIPNATTLPEPTEAPPPPPREPGPRELGRPGGAGPGPRETPPPPRPRDFAREAWDRAESQINISMSMVVAGIILVLLGAVRIGFVPAEKRFVTTLGR